MSGISIWRLAAIIKHKAATSPTFDPTWYGPSIVILGMMEVNAASVCACVPVFWPVLSARLDNIFVTQEIQITREARFGERLDDEERQLHTPTSRRRSGSLLSQFQLSKQKTASSYKQGHYDDDYVLEQVDPLRHKSSVAAISSKSSSK